MDVNVFKFMSHLHFISMGNKKSGDRFTKFIVKSLRYKEESLWKMEKGCTYKVSIHTLKSMRLKSSSLQE